MDSNHRPHPYQRCALTSWATHPYARNFLQRFLYKFTPQNQAFFKKIILHPNLSCFLTSFHYTKTVLFWLKNEMDIICCIIWIILCIIAIIGSILPWLPWPQLWYISILLAQFFMDKPFSRWFVIIRWVLMIILTILDYYLPILWTKKFWWTKRWNRWCIIWMIIWMLFWPLGLILCPFLWALIWEFLHRNYLQKAIKPAFWAFLWFISWIVLKLAVSIILLIYFCIGCYHHFFLTLDSFPITTNDFTTLL